MSSYPLGLEPLGPVSTPILTTSSTARIIKTSPGSSVGISSVERNAASVALNCTCVNRFPLSVFLLWSNAQLRLCRCLNEWNLIFLFEAATSRKKMLTEFTVAKTDVLFPFLCLQTTKVIQTVKLEVADWNSQVNFLTLKRYSFLRSPDLCRKIPESQLWLPGKKIPH